MSNIFHNSNSENVARYCKSLCKVYIYIGKGVDQMLPSNLGGHYVKRLLLHGVKKHGAATVVTSRNGLSFALEIANDITTSVRSGV